MISDVLRKLELGNVPVATPTGRLVGASGLLLESIGCTLRTGQRCSVETADGEWIDAQVVGFRGDVSYLMPFKSPEGLEPAPVFCRARNARRCASGLPGSGASSMAWVNPWMDAAGSVVSMCSIHNPDG